MPASGQVLRRREPHGQEGLARQTGLRRWPELWGGLRPTTGQLRTAVPACEAYVTWLQTGFPWGNVCRIRSQRANSPVCARVPGTSVPNLKATSQHLSPGTCHCPCHMDSFAPFPCSNVFQGVDAAHSEWSAVPC